MSFRAFRDLEEALGSLADKRNNDDVNDKFVSAFSSAWLFVDSINRLCELLPLVSKSTDNRVVQEFIAAAASTRSVRNSVQHLKEMIDRVVSNGHSAWGSIGWLTPSTEEGSVVAAHLISAGSVQLGDHPKAKLRFLGTAIDRSDSVFLEVHGTVVRFSCILKKVEALVQFLEEFTMTLGRCPSRPLENIHVTVDAITDPRSKGADPSVEMAVPAPPWHDQD